jgi:hypothetical protein
MIVNIVWENLSISEIRPGVRSWSGPELAVWMGAKERYHPLEKALRVDVWYVDKKLSEL